MPKKKLRPWFRVKSFGYGAGLPIAWQGWLLLVAYIAAMILSALLLPPLAFTAVFVLLTAAVVFIAYIRSDEEWRWRNGRQD